jgi:hypothetical protein
MISILVIVLEIMFVVTIMSMILILVKIVFGR